MNNEAEITGRGDALAQSKPKRVRMATTIITLALVVYWAALFYGTHTKIPPGLLPGNSDKHIHFASYAGLAALLLSLRATQGTFPWMTVVRRWFVLAGYGAFDELSQLLVNRTTDFSDWLADVSGAAFGLGLVTFGVWWLSRLTGRLDSRSTADTVPN